MEGKSAIRCQKPSPQHWMHHSIGRSGFRLASILSSWNSETGDRDPEIRVQVEIFDDDAKKHFAILETQKREIEGEVGHSLFWHNPPEKRSSRIYTRRSADFFNRNDWPSQHEWLRENVEKFYKVFGPRIKQLDVSDFEEDPTSLEAL